ncbi:(Na+)-NQR maturation NqrM [Halioxenophilus aromaticivorans]|uniref:(Na+)-NQR maturation NqrM n=1 Tax=Halioxenophilus aromaticivorans TaxID=1306992 RepID=A0AAV3TY25_9ALTE
MTFLVTLCVLLLVVGAMSIGVILGRKPISGSCGGIGAALDDPDYVCDFCGNDESKCEERQQELAQTQKPQAQNLSYDATNKTPNDR